MPFCNNCGKENPQDASFCNYCGNRMGMPQARVEVTHRFEQAPTYKLVQLRHAYCEGTGTDTHCGPMGIKCLTCKGTGTVSIRIDSTESLVKCPICRGSRVDDTISMIGVECENCHGTGRIPQKILTY